MIMYLLAFFSLNNRQIPIIIMIYQYYRRQKSTKRTHHTTVCSFGAAMISREQFRLKEN